MIFPAFHSIDQFRADQASNRLLGQSGCLHSLVGPERKMAGIGHLETSLQVSAQWTLEVSHRIESPIGQVDLLIHPPGFMAFGEKNSSGCAPKSSRRKA